MAAGMIYLKETTRSGSVLWETVACAACLKTHLDTFPDAEMATRGDRRVLRPWTGESRECGFCDEDTMDAQREAEAR